MSEMAQEIARARARAAELRFRAAMVEEFADELEDSERRRNRAKENAGATPGRETGPVEAEQTR